jgi:hypothetical protein
METKVSATDEEPKVPVSKVEAYVMEKNQKVKKMLQEAREGTIQYELGTYLAGDDDYMDGYSASLYPDDPVYQKAWAIVTGPVVDEQEYRRALAYIFKKR